MQKLKIGIVGCGAIGSSLAKIISKELKNQVELSALYDIDPAKSRHLALMLRKDLAVDKLTKLISKSQLVIECASAKASFEIAKKTLSAGCSIMVMSVGGLIGKAGQLEKLAKNKKARLYIPSGAISGVDALKAAGQVKISKVTLTTRKNPLSFRGVEYIAEQGIDLSGIKEDRVLFDGAASEAVKHFPQNINVAAVLSLAGVGPEQTRVRIIASPSATKNIHEIEIECSAGRILTRTENILHPENPKTSYLAVLSAMAVLKQILSPVKIGT